MKRMNYYVIQNSEQSQRQFSLISNELPVIKLLFNKQQMQQMLAEIPHLLSLFNEKLQQKITKFRSASSVQQQYRAVDERLQQLVQDIQEQGKLNPEQALKLYDGFAYLLEFVMKQIPLEDGLTLEEKTFAKYNNRPKDLQWFTEQLLELFQREFSIEPTVQKINIETDQLGMNDEGTMYSYYIFAGYDVLYNYPLLFKTEDVPGFVFNIAQFLQQDADAAKGKTKTAVTTFAYERVMKGMGLKNKENSVFTYSFNPLYKLQLSDYSAPFIAARTRQKIYRVKSYEIMSTYEGIHYITGERRLEIQRQPVEILEPEAYISCQYSDLHSSKLDQLQLPIFANWIKDKEQLQQQVNQIEEYSSYHQVILQQFFNKEQEV